MGQHQRDYYVREKARKLIERQNRVSISTFTMYGGDTEVRVRDDDIRMWFRRRNQAVLYIPTVIPYKEYLVPLRVFNLYQYYNRVFNARNGL